MSEQYQKKKALSILIPLVLCIPPLFLLAIGSLGWLTDWNYRKSHTMEAPWVKEATNPIWETSNYAWSALTPNSPTILRNVTTGAPIQYDDKYWMAYAALEGANFDGIGLATSINLVNWTDAVGNPILTEDDPKAEVWEEKNPAPSEFLYMGDEEDHAFDFWIFYRANDEPPTQTCTGVIKSNNMTVWERDIAHNPVASWVPDWRVRAFGVEDFRVQKNSEGDWVALYECDQTEGATDAAVGAASSNHTLPHSGWVDEGPVCSSDFGGQFIANPTLIRRTINDVDYYYSWYEWGAEGWEVEQAYGMYVEESDFFTLDGWTQLDNPQVPGDAEWEGDRVIPECILLVGDDFYLYYNGHRLSDGALGLATNAEVEDYLQWRDKNE